MRKEKRSPYFRIGTAPGVEFPTEGAPAPDFPLVAPHGDDFAFNFAHGMEGEMVVNGQSTTLAELAAQGRTTISPIPSGAKIRVRAGKTTFLVSSVPRPRRHAMPLFAALESRVHRVLRAARSRSTSASAAPARCRFPSRTRPRTSTSPSLEDTVDAHQQRLAGRSAAARGGGQARRRRGRVGRYRHGHGARRRQDGQEGLGPRRGPVQDAEDAGRPAARSPAGNRAGAQRPASSARRRSSRVARSRR